MTTDIGQVLKMPPPIRIESVRLLSGHNVFHDRSTTLLSVTIAPIIDAYLRDPTHGGHFSRLVNARLISLKPGSVESPREVGTALDALAYVIARLTQSRDSNRKSARIVGGDSGLRIAWETAGRARSELLARLAVQIVLSALPQRFHGGQLISSSVLTRAWRAVAELPDVDYQMPVQKCLIAGVAGDRGIGVTARRLDRLFRALDLQVGMALRQETFDDHGPLLVRDQREGIRGLLRKQALDAVVRTVSLRGYTEYGLGHAHLDLAIAQERDKPADGVLFRQGLAALARATRGPIVYDTCNLVAREAIDVDPQRLVLVSEMGANKLVTEHLRDGGRAAVFEHRAGRRLICVYDRHDTAAEIVIDSGARSGRQSPDRAELFAFAGAWSLGYPIDRVADAFVDVSVEERRM